MDSSVKISPEESMERAGAATNTTGADLMSGEIPKSGVAMSRKQKEIDYVMTNIRHRLATLEAEQGFEAKKLLYLSISLVSSGIAVVLMLFGLRKTPLFDYYTGK